jgi:hypothetical protein
MEQILEMDDLRCPTCGHNVPAPNDGRWRFARGGKVHESVEIAETRCESLRKRSPEFEYRAVAVEGGARIATRRRS